MSETVPLQALITGFGASAALIIAIGAQNAFVLRQGLVKQHVGKIVAICALSDAVLIAAGVAGLGLLISKQPVLLDVVRYGGAAFLTAYAAMALKRAFKPASLKAAQSNGTLTAQQAVFATLAFTFLNPHVYLDTVLLLGSMGAQAGHAKWWFAAGGAVASFSWFTLLGYGSRALAPMFANPKAWQVLDTLIAAVMLSLAVTLIYN